MVITTETPQLCTIGEVRRQLIESGMSRSKTAIRRLEARGVVTPIRSSGHDRRLYTLADVETIKAAIRERRHTPEVA